MKDGSSSSRGTTSYFFIGTKNQFAIFLCQMTIEILKYLDFVDRLQCRLVCPTWLQILTTERCFNADLRIVFDGSLDRPLPLDPGTEPVRNFATSEIKHQRMLIGKNVVNIDRLINVNRFNDIVELDIDASHLRCNEPELRTQTHQIFISLPRLKRFTILNCPQDYFDVYYLFNEDSLVDVQNSNVLMNLEELTINLCETWSIIMINFFEPLEAFLRLRPNVKKICIENMSEDNNDELLDFQKKHQQLQIDAVFVAKFSRVVGLYKIINFTEVEYEKIEQSIDGQKYWDYFWKQVVRLQVNCEKVGSSEIEPDWPTEKLVHMKHLRELEIREVGTRCFFGIKVARNTSVRLVTLYNCQFVCPKCLDAMRLSFPNLRKLVHDSPEPLDPTVKFSEKTEVVPYQLNYSLK